MSQAENSTATTTGAPATTPAALFPPPAYQQPLVIQVGSGFVPVIYHPSRQTPYLRLERLRRKANATEAEALAYAARVIWYRRVRAAEKRRKLEATVHPRYLGYLRRYLEAAE